MAASKEMELAIKIAGKIDSSFNSAMSAVGKGIKGATKMMAAGAVAAGAAVGAITMKAIDVGREYEQAMSQVQATMLLDTSTEEGAAAMATLEEAARQCGRETAFSATEAAEALNYLALAGYNADESAAALPVVLKLAGAGAMQLGDASNMLTDALGALQLEPTQENLESFADQMAKTASISNTSVSQLGEAILTVGGTAAGLKGGTAELMAMAGTLANVGIKGAEGGTHIRNMIMSLQEARNSDAAALFEEMGLSAYDAEGNMRSMGEIFGDVNKYMTENGATAEEVNHILSTIFKQTDLAAARAMLAATADTTESLGSVLDASLAESGKSLADMGINLEELAGQFDATMSQEQFAAQMMEQYGMDAETAGLMFQGLSNIVGGTGSAFGQLQAAIEDSQGACDEMYKIQLDNLNGDLAILKSALADVGITIFKELAPGLRAGTQMLTGMVNEVAAAYEGGGLQGMAGAIGSCLAEVLTAIGEYAPQVIDAGMELIGGLLNGLSANSDSIASSAAEVVTQFASGVVSMTPDLVFTAIDLITSFGGYIADNVDELGTAATTAFERFSTGLADRIPTISSTAVRLVNRLARTIVTNAPRIIASGILLIASLAQGLIQALPGLLVNGFYLVLGLAAAIIENLPLLVDTGASLIGQLLDGFLTALPDIIMMAIQIVPALASALIEMAPRLLSTGAELIAKLITGIVKGVVMLIMSIPALFAGVTDAILNIDWLGIGGQCIDALVGAFTTGIENLKELWHNFTDWLGGGTEVVDDHVEGSGPRKDPVGGFYQPPAQQTEVVQQQPEIQEAAGPAMQATTQTVTNTVNVETNAVVDAAGNTQKALNDYSQNTQQAVTASAQDIDSAVDQYMSGLFSSLGDNSAAENAGKSAEQICAELTSGITSNGEGAVNAASQTSDRIAEAFENMKNGTTGTGEGLLASIMSEMESGAGQASSAADVLTTAYTSALDSGFSSYTPNFAALEAAAANEGTSLFDKIQSGVAGKMLDVASTMGIDTAGVTTAFQSAGTQGGSAFSAALSGAVGGYAFGADSVGMDSATVSSTMQASGTAGGQSFTTSLQSAISSGSGAVVAAVTSMVNRMNMAMTSGWSRMRSSAVSAMNSLVSICSAGASRAAGAIRSAFSNMHITVPRPKLPVISYTTDSVSFGEGGSVSIPKFSVHWNALGGIFDRATLLPGMNGLQGVGEAGPEAVLPLDTLWQHMREIMADTLQGSLFEQMLDRLDRLTGGNGNANQMQLAGAGGETIVFSPTYNLYGSATKDDAVAAGRQTFEEFKRFMAQYERDKRRKRF